MYIFKLFTIIAVLSISLLADKPDASEFFKKLQKNNFTQSIQEPKIQVDRKMLNATVAGVDMDKDGLRDDIQKVIYQSLKFSRDLNVSVYKQTLEVAKMIQPSKPAAKDIIDEHEVYCHYKALPEVVKEEISLDFLYSIMIDTKDRQKAFNMSVKASNASLGEEMCK